MPTQRARYMLTETPEVEAALARARERWPEDRDRPARLLLRLIGSGDHALQQEQQDRLDQRRRLIEELSGGFTGLYPPGYLEALREDWPE